MNVFFLYFCECIFEIYLFSNNRQLFKQTFKVILKIKENQIILNDICVCAPNTLLLVSFTSKYLKILSEVHFPLWVFVEDRTPSFITEVEREHGFLFFSLSSEQPCYFLIISQPCSQKSC